MTTYTHRARLLGVLVSFGVLIGAPQVATAATPSYSISSFTGAVFDTISPGDVSIAVGPNNVVETTNMKMTVFSRTGTKQSEVQFSSFFPGAATPFCIDPNVVYSAPINRFAVVCSDDMSNHVTNVAVSQTGNPDGAWTKFNAGANTDVDQPSIQITKNKLIVAGNGPFGCGSGCGTAVFTFQLSDILAGSTSPRMKYINVPRGQYRSAQQISPNGTGYLVQAFPGSDVFLGRVTGTPAAGNVAFTETDLGADPLTTEPQQPTIPGGSIGLGDLDGRVMNATYQVLASGAKTIEFSQTALCGSFNCEGDGRITLTSTGPVLSYVKSHSVSGVDVSWGSVVDDGNGRPLMAYTRSSPAQSPQAAIMSTGLNKVVRNAAPGATACTGGATPPCADRWGDYLGAARDPSNPSRVWLAGLYLSSTGGDGWSTVITSVTVIR